jgi:serine/threonine-protein kinase
VFKYAVERQLASGGMADLFAATGVDGQPVVIKRLKEHLIDQSELREMFLREGKLATTLDHPNIVKVLEVGTWPLGDDLGDLPCLVMERLVGQDLREVLQARGRLPLRETCLIAIQVVDALAHAHAFCVHRDVSPHNIFVTTTGQVKLLDFGIAKTTEAATTSGLVRGKVGYMAPEQIEGLDVDPRTDLFALGVVIWECLAGRALWDRESATGTARAIREESAPMLTGVPEPIARLVAQMLSKFPTARPRRAADVASALAPYAR